MAFKIFLFLALVASSLAGPISNKENQDVLEKCSAICPLMDYPSIGFIYQKTYFYSYTGSSQVQMSESMPKNGSMDWKADVLLSMVSPCQFTIQVKNPVINNHAGDHITTELLTSYPLVVTMMEGVVTNVCEHPMDHPTGLNMKKGIVSAIQMSMPEFFSDARGRTITETDVLGRCPTEYRINSTNSWLIVQKNKDHKECDRAHSTDAESPVTVWWLKSPLPLAESRSQCIQEWNKKTRILQKSSCEDINQGKLMLGSYKKINAYQRSVLSLVKTEDKVVVQPFVNGIIGNLTFSVIPQPKTDEVMPEVEDLLKKLCNKVQDKISEYAAFDWAKIIGLLHRVPERNIKLLLQNIRSGKYCQKSEILEELYQDAIMFVNNGGAVETMVDEVISGKVNMGRTPFYTIAIHLLRKPCIHSVEEMKRLLESKQAPPSMKLAAGTLVSKYCKFHPSCLQQQPVREILDILKRQVDSNCASSSSSKEKRSEALTALKTVGNMAEMNPSLAESIVQCVKSEEADTLVRVAAAQSFRQAKCNQRAMTELIKVALNPKVETEVRIASYLMSITCSSFEQASMILEKISVEANTQVRAFILSDLRNLQTTDAPYLRGLRYNLSSLIIPNDYEKDFRLYSRSTELSYYLPTMGLGAGIDSNLIYSPGSYIPRQWQANFTTNLFDNVINIGELAIRMEDIESIYELLFSPDGYLATMPTKQILKDLSLIVQGHGSQVIDQFSKKMKMPTIKVNEDSLSDIMSTMFKSKDNKGNQPKVDTFARIFGQEVLFTSISGVFKRVDREELMEKLVDAVIRMFMKASKVDSRLTKSLQVNTEVFVPTQQGIPFQIKMVHSIITSLKVKGSASVAKTEFTTNPQLSIDTNSFLGYTLGAKAGLRVRGNAFVNLENKLKVDVESSKARIILDGPINFVDIKFDGKAYAVFKMPSKKDVTIAPKKNSYPVVRKQDCILLEGLKTCYDILIPDYSKTNIFPFGAASGKVSMKKAIPSKEIAIVNCLWKNDMNEKNVAMKLEMPGAPVPMIGEIDMTYKTSSDFKSLMFYLHGSQTEKAVKLDIETKETQNGKKLDMAVYAAERKTLSASDKVLTVIMGAGFSNKELQAETTVKTMNGLEKYLKADIETNVLVKLVQHENYWYPTSMNLRKFEVEIAVPKVFSTVNFIRPKSSNGATSEYSIQSLTRTSKQEILSIRGMTKKQGSIEDTNLDSMLMVEVKTPSKHYETEMKVVYKRLEKQIFAKVLKLDDHKKNILLADLSIVKRSADSKDYDTKALLEIPSWIPIYSVSGVLSQKASTQYDIKLMGKRDQKPVFTLEGPLQWMTSAKQWKQQSRIKIKCEESRTEYLATSNFNISPEKQVTSFELKSGRESLFKLEGETSVSSWEQFSSNVGVHVPKMIEAKVRAERAAQMFNVDLAGFLKPNTPLSQRLKGLATVDLREKNIRTKLSYNLDKNPDAVVAANIKYDYDQERKYASVKGDLLVSKDKYLCRAETILGSYTENPNDRNELIISIVKPDGQEFILKSDCKTKKFSHFKTLDYKGFVQLRTGIAYKIESEFKYAVDSAPWRMIVVGNTTIETPTQKPVSFKLNTDVDLTKKYKKVICQTEVTTSDKKKPLKADINIQSRRSEITSDIMINVDVPAIKLVSSTRAQKNDREQIQDVTLQIDLQLPNKNQYKIKTEKISGEKLEIYLMSKNVKVLAWEHSRKGPGEWEARLTLPSRTIEGRSKISDKEFSLALYPKKDSSLNKYLVGAHYEGSGSLFGGISLAAGAQIMYPGLEKPVQIKTDLKLSDSTCKGKVVLDIFKKKNETIIIGVQVTQFDEKTYKLEAELAAPAYFTSTVHSIAEITNAREMVLIKMWVYSSPTLTHPDAEILFDIRTPLDTNGGTVVFKVYMKEDRVEFASQFKIHELAQCNGGSINGTVKFVREKKSYDFASSICGPFYFEAGIKESHDNKMYIAKVGMKNPSAAKIAVDLVYDSTDAFNISSVSKLSNTLNLYGKHIYLPKQSVAKIGAKLWAPMMVTLDAKYDTVKMNDYMNDVLKPLVRVLEKIADEIQKSLPEDFIRKLAPILSENIVEELWELIKEVKDAARKAFYDVFGIEPDWTIIKDHIKNLYKKTLKIWKNVIVKLEDLLHKYFNLSLDDVHNRLKQIDSAFQTGLKYIHRETEELVKAFMEGKEALMNYRLIKMIVNFVEGNSVWEWIEEKLHKLEHWLANEWNWISETFKKYSTELVNDLKKIFHKIVRWGHFKQFWKWLASWLFDHHEYSAQSLTSSLVQKYYSIYMNEKEAFLRVQVPLRRPVASLASAIMSVGIPLPPRKCVNHMYRPLSFVKSAFRPHVAKGEILENQIITFDGLVLPLMKLDCVVTLANASGVSILIDMKTTEIQVLTKNGKESVVISHTFGSEPKVQGLTKAGKIEKQDLTLLKQQDGSIEVDTKVFKIVADKNKIEVEAKPSAFNKVQGLLGTHDSEKATDMHMKSEVSYKPRSYEGKHHLSAKSMKQLLDVNKVSKSCNV